MKYISLILLMTFLIACSHTQEASVTALETQTTSLIEEKNVVETVNRLFVSTDNRDWEGVKDCFADKVVMELLSIICPTLPGRIVAPS